MAGFLKPTSTNFQPASENCAPEPPRANSAWGTCGGHQTNAGGQGEARSHEANGRILRWTHHPEKSARCPAFSGFPPQNLGVQFVPPKSRWCRTSNLWFPFEHSVVTLKWVVRCAASDGQYPVFAEGEQFRRMEFPLFVPFVWQLFENERISPAVPKSHWATVVSSRFCSVFGVALSFC